MCPRALGSSTPRGWAVVAETREVEQEEPRGKMGKEPREVEAEVAEVEARMTSLGVYLRVPGGMLASACF